MELTSNHVGSKQRFSCRKPSPYREISNHSRRYSLFKSRTFPSCQATSVTSLSRLLTILHTICPSHLLTSASFSFSTAARFARQLTHSTPNCSSWTVLVPTLQSPNRPVAGMLIHGCEREEFRYLCPHVGHFTAMLKRRHIELAVVTSI